MIRLIRNKFSAILGEKLLRVSKISNDTGISRTTLTNLYYRRSRGIEFETLDKLCDYLGCKIEDLFEHKPDEE